MKNATQIVLWSHLCKQHSTVMLGVYSAWDETSGPQPPPDTYERKSEYTVIVVCWPEQGPLIATLCRFMTPLTYSDGLHSSIRAIAYRCELC